VYHFCVSLMAGGAKSHLQTGWGQWPDFPLDPPVVNVNNRRRLRSLNISLLRAYTKYIGEQDALFVLQLTTSSHGPNTYYLVGRPMWRRRPFRWFRLIL